MSKLLGVAPSMGKSERVRSLAAPPLPSRYMWYRIAVRCFHGLLSLYLMAWAVLHFRLDPGTGRETAVFAKLITPLCFVFVSLLHGLAMCCQSHVQSVVHRTDVVPFHASTSTKSLPEKSRRRWWRLQLALYKWHDVVIAALNACDIASQSSRAFLIATSTPDVAVTQAFLVVAIFNSFLAPVLLYLRNGTTSRDVLVNAVDFAVSVTMSTGLPLVCVVVELMDVVAGTDPTVFQDNEWLARTLSYTNTIVVATSFDDFLGKFWIYIGTYISLRRLHDTLNGQGIVIPADDPAATKWTRRVLKANMALAFTWGAVLTFVAVHVTTSPSPCPPHCVARARSLTGRDCICLYADIVCNATTTPADVSRLLDPAIVGTALLVMQLQHCAVPDGLDTATLAPFSKLYKVLVLNSTMTSWNASLPPSVCAVVIRQSRLRELPAVFRHNVPPSLFTISIDSSPLGTLPSDAFELWPSLKRLQITNASLAAIPPNALTLPRLLESNLRDNAIDTVPAAFQLDSHARLPRLQNFRMNGNRLTTGPWAMLRRGLVVNLSANPIGDAPPTDVTDGVIMDGTAYCTAALSRAMCTALCSPRCYKYMRGDRYCDPACNTQACGFDNRDCASRS